MNNVYKKWRNDPALWCSFLRVDELSIGQFDWGFEYAQNFFEQVFISDSERPHLPNKFAVVDIIEKSLDVEFDDVIR